MGKPAGRLGDMGSNHGPWHPSPLIAGSGDVFINSKPAARKGDALAPHKKPKKPPHGRSMASGASTVLINGKPAVRVGDKISCGGSLAAGSSNVFIGDSPKIKKTTLLNLPPVTFDKAQLGEPPVNAYPQAAVPSGSGGTVKIDDSNLAPLVEAPPELKDATIRLAINPSDKLFSQTQFILKSTDGSITITKTVKDDQVPGDNFVDLEFTGLDTGKNYSLTQTDTDGGEFTYFESFSYGSIGLQSREPEDDSETEE